MRTWNRLSKVLNCCLLVENSANGFARSSFQMQLCYLGVHAPLRTSRWQTNKKCLNYLMIYCSINKCLCKSDRHYLYCPVQILLWKWGLAMYKLCNKPPLAMWRSIYNIYIQFKRPYHKIIFIGHPVAACRISQICTLDKLFKSRIWSNLRFGDL